LLKKGSLVIRRGFKMALYYKNTRTPWLTGRDDECGDETNYEYFSEDIRTFKRNMNHSKTLLIEANRRRKERVLEVISKADEEMESCLVEVAGRLAKSKSKLIKYVSDFEAACDKICATLTPSDVVKQAQEKTESILLKRYGELMTQTTKLENSFQLDLKKHVQTEKAMMANHRKQFSKNLAQIYRNEKNLVEDSIEAVAACKEDVINYTRHIRPHIDAVIEAKVNKQLNPMVCKTLEILKKASSAMENKTEKDTKPFKKKAQ